MFEGFHTFATISSLSALSICQPSVLRQCTLQGRGAQFCFMIPRCEAPPPFSPALLWCIFTHCVHLRSQDSSYGGWRLSSGLLFASSLRCNRNNPIKWWIAFHTDYWASGTPAGGGRDKVATAGTQLHSHTVYRPTGHHAHRYFRIIMAVW